MPEVQRLCLMFFSSRSLEKFFVLALQPQSSSRSRFPGHRGIILIIIGMYSGSVRG